jgi:hypothetical protein
MKITKRNVFVFILGMLTWMTLEMIYDWEGTKTNISKTYQTRYDAGSK